MFWKEYRLSIWVAIVLSAVVLVWMVSWSWEVGVPEPRPGRTMPDFVHPRVTSTTVSSEKVLDK